MKGGFQWWCPDVIVITTNKSPWDWYQYVSRDYEREALFRRIETGGAYFFRKNAEKSLYRKLSIYTKKVHLSMKIGANKLKGLIMHLNRQTFSMLKVSDIRHLLRSNRDPKHRLRVALYILTVPSCLTIILSLIVLWMPIKTIIINKIKIYLKSIW